MKKIIFLFYLTLMISVNSKSQVQMRFDFTTGGDDLRGGNDNVNIIVILNNGNLVRFNNVNSKAKWNNNSTKSVSRSLGSPTQINDIKGVRIETTFSGGGGGDNWNLDKLTVNAKAGSTNRTLYSQTGRPLFRFTGDQRVKEFLFTPGGPVSSPSVMTSFKPSVNGFKFSNSFKNIFISAVDWTTSGLCGGMSYSALDYYNSRKSIPQQNYMPAEGTVLQSYIYNRQVNSIVDNVDKWTEYGFNPGGARNREFFNWGIQTGSGRLGELMNKIDAGSPVPLGLQSCGNDCNCSGGCPGSHQVLAIGYKLGRYNGDLKNHIEDVCIFVYDPNYPGQTMTLKPNVAGAWYSYTEATNKKWRAYFVDYKYRPKSPPVIAAQPSEIIITFVTGDDDLRGGNDNVNVALKLKSGKELSFPNVNSSKRWIDRSSQTIARNLPATINANDIVGIKLTTTFGGGFGGDNWNLNEITINIRIRGGTPVQKFTSSGNPLFRFTGNQKIKEFIF